MLPAANVASSFAPRLHGWLQDYAVICAIPVDAEGITYIYGRQSCDTRSMEPENEIDQGNAKFGGQELTIVYDDVFVPNDLVFMNGE